MNFNRKPQMYNDKMDPIMPKKDLIKNYKTSLDIQ